MVAQRDPVPESGARRRKGRIDERSLRVDDVHRGNDRVQRRAHRGRVEESDGAGKIRNEPKALLQGVRAPEVPDLDPVDDDGPADGDVQTAIEIRVRREHRDPGALRDEALGSSGNRNDGSAVAIRGLVGRSGEQHVHGAVRNSEQCLSRSESRGARSPRRENPPRETTVR